MNGGSLSTLPRTILDLLEGRLRAVALCRERSLAEVTLVLRRDQSGSEHSV